MLALKPASLSSIGNVTLACASKFLSTSKSPLLFDVPLMLILNASTFSMKFEASTIPSNSTPSSAVDISNSASLVSAVPSNFMKLNISSTFSSLPLTIT